MAGSPVLSVVVATAITFGLRDSLDGPKDEAPIVQEVDDGLLGLDDEPPVDLHLEWGSPDETWVVVRPWGRK